jgi:hypothetical protein
LFSAACAHLRSESEIPAEPPASVLQCAAWRWANANAIGAFNLGLWMRSLFGIGTPRALQGRVAALTAVFSALSSLVQIAITPLGSPTACPTG